MASGDEGMNGMNGMNGSRILTPMDNLLKNLGSLMNAWDFITITSQMMMGTFVSCRGA